MLTGLPDYWEIAPAWNQEGIPKKLERGESSGYGMSAVRKRRLGYQHTIFSKQPPHMSATVNQFIASQFAHHLDFPLAPLLFGPDERDIHSLRMVFNVRSGSLFEVLLEKIKRSDPDVPQKVIESYQDHLKANGRHRKYQRMYQQSRL